MADYISKLNSFFASRWGIIFAGAVIGVLASLLVYWGNPKNMGICVACFERDIAGGLGLHRAGVVQYIRPEIIGFVLIMWFVWELLQRRAIIRFLIKGRAY